MAYYNNLQLDPKNQITYLIVVYISKEERVCFYLIVVYILQKSLLLQCYVTGVSIRTGQIQSLSKETKPTKNLPP